VILCARVLLFEITLNRKEINLGAFDNIIDAVASRIKANKKYGFTARH